MRAAAVERLLPLAYQRADVEGSALAALLDVMETLHARDEQILDHIDDLYTPYRSPDGLVPFLAHWVAMDHVLAPPQSAAPPMPLGRLRDLVGEGAALAQWRGTPYGMSRLLRVATGVTGIAVDEPPDRPFHLRVRVPATASDQLGLVSRLVRAEKPAATTYEVVLDPTLNEETT
ncbi:MAG TPA: phage tail protein [Micromonosporaceae bacterium]|nr:phage tail protein [Micromonosporaceae bacterium]